MIRLLALGDSHLDALQFAAKSHLLTVDESNFCIVPGATAVGLRNPNSITNAVSIFRAAAKKHCPSSFVLIHLGEVDCGFVMWWRQEKYGESIDRQINDSLGAYRDFVIELQHMGFQHICLTGASLPTIRDGIDFGDVANKRKEVSASLKARTELTSRYNHSLFLMSKSLSCEYFDLSTVFLDKTQGVVADFFRSADLADHHLDVKKVTGVWAMACNSFISKHDHCSELSI